MGTETVTLFFGFLAVTCQLFVLASLVLVALRPVSSGAAAALDRLRTELAPVGLWLAFAVAGTATAGSLYLSEVAGFTPCRLCWYQRGLMYPLALLLGFAAWRGWSNVRRIAIPLAAVGATISVYHLVVERYPELETATCDPDNPCSIIWFEHFNYLTIPGMALSGFLAVIALLALTPEVPREQPSQPTSAAGADR